MHSANNLTMYVCDGMTAAKGANITTTYKNATTQVSPHAMNVTATSYRTKPRTETSGGESNILEQSRVEQSRAEYNIKRRNDGTKERRNEGTKERRNEGTKERRSEGAKERRSEGAKERRNKGAS